MFLANAMRYTQLLSNFPWPTRKLYSSPEVWTRNDEASCDTHNSYHSTKQVGHLTIVLHLWQRDWDLPNLKQVVEVCYDCHIACIHEQLSIDQRIESSYRCRKYGLRHWWRWEDDLEIVLLMTTVKYQWFANSDCSLFVKGGYWWEVPVRSAG